jgi:hypothetical protein
MPRPRGPEKVAFKVSVTIPTFHRLVAKAKGKAVGAYIAEREERATLVASKRPKPVLPTSPSSTHTSDGSPESTESAAGES